MGKLCMISFLCNSIFPFLILLFCLLFGSLTADFPNRFKGIGCDLINCGEGTCNSSGSFLLGFECECNPGWKKIQIGSLSFSPCVIPNCTVNLGCGRNTPTPPPPPPPPPPPASQFSPLNFSDHCALTWCGDGTCITNETGHICSCHEGSYNLFNNTSFACFKQCSFGADCTSFGFNLSPSSPSSNSNSPVSAQNGMPPPPSSSNSDSTDSTRNGACGKPNWWMTLFALTMPPIAVIFIYSA